MINGISLYGRSLAQIPFSLTSSFKFVDGSAVSFVPRLAPQATTSFLDLKSFDMLSGFMLPLNRIMASPWILHFMLLARIQLDSIVLPVFRLANLLNSSGSEHISRVFNRGTLVASPCSSLLDLDITQQHEFNVICGRH